jgi:hypothetical protein
MSEFSSMAGQNATVADIKAFFAPTTVLCCLAGDRQAEGCFVRT